jgi:hypothetical protein
MRAIIKKILRSTFISRINICYQANHIQIAYKKISRFNGVEKMNYFIYNKNNHKIFI